MRYLSMIALLAGLGWALSGGAAENAADWGAVKGRIVWAGDVPAPVKAAVDKDQDHCLSKGDIIREDLVVNAKNKGVRWAYVWLAPADVADKAAKLKVHPARQAIKDKEIVIDQPCCMFVPHAVGMRQGQVLVARNTAPVAHNFRWTGGLKNPGGNVIIPPKSDKKIDDLQADRFPVTLACDIHKWMKGWVRVFDHPYFAVTDADGGFEIKDAPAGPCRLVVWHEEVGWRGGREGRNGVEIAVKGGGTTDLGDLNLEPSK